jgi:hypothetical protein
LNSSSSLVGVLHQQAVRLTKQEEFGIQNFAGEEHRQRRVLRKNVKAASGKKLCAPPTKIVFNLT